MLIGRRLKDTSRVVEAPKEQTSELRETPKFSRGACYNRQGLLALIVPVQAASGLPY